MKNLLVDFHLLIENISIYIINQIILFRQNIMSIIDSVKA